eukprot:3430457-Prymnesium_polylepis.1
MRSISERIRFFTSLSPASSSPPSSAAPSSSAPRASGSSVPGAESAPKRSHPIACSSWSSPGSDGSAAGLQKVSVP